MEDKKSLKFIFFALMAWGEGISGGDKISIEMARMWGTKYPVTVYLWEEGYRMYTRQHLDPKKLELKVVDMNPWKKMGFAVNYLARIIAGMWIAIRINPGTDSTVIYSATEFWMDSLPGFILKMRFPRITLVNTFFQTAPNPFIGFKEGERAASYRLRALVYWLIQLPIKALIKRCSDFVLVNNEDERKQFSDMDKKGKVIVVLGAVNLREIKKWQLQEGTLPKIFDGVFQGRFHPQKGIIELIDIWKLVVDKKPDAQLALIGDGPLMEKVKSRIKELGLQKNIKLFGYVFDGIKKYRIFAQSKIALHPAFYDSGGMAAAEAMAFGIPAVGFNLNAYKSYYPAGMVKVRINDLQAFAQAVLELLKKKSLYSKMANEAEDMISQNWSWDKRSEEVLRYII